MRRTLIVLAVLAMALGLVAGIPASAGAGGETVCLVADPGGFDDGSFNEMALEGLQRAERRLGITADAREPADEGDIPLILDDLVTSGHCDLIIGVGFLVAGPMEAFLVATDQRFAAIDFAYFDTYPNVAELLFRVDQAAFLAGYVAAKISDTGAIGTYGGAPIPQVTMFMDGYALGAEYYNAQHGDDVDVLGWNPETQMGLLLDFEFQNPALGYTTTMGLFAEGADTVMAVAGPTGLGSLAAAADHKAATGANVRVVEPDFDWFTLDRDPDRILLTSVLKQVDVAVYHNIEALVDGTWLAGWTWEDLESGGVDIAPFHRTRNQVRGVVRDLRMIRAGIIDGTIDTLPYELP